MAEFVPGYDATGLEWNWRSEEHTAEDRREAQQCYQRCLANSRIKLRIAEFGDTVFASSPAEFGKHIVEFTDKWSKVIRAANIIRPPCL